MASTTKTLILATIASVLMGCQMDMGKTTEYVDGKVSKITETRSKASTVQSVTTVFGLRFKTLAPQASDASPIEIDLGLARNALQVVPLGEKASISTDWTSPLFWDDDKLVNKLEVNTPPTKIPPVPMCDYPNELIPRVNK